jgi:predicted transcriptional regulator of viral defense system
MPTTSSTSKPIAFSPARFFGARAVFRLDHYQRAHRTGGSDPASAMTALAYHVEQGHIVNLRRGLYARHAKVDPFLVAACLTSDAVIAYDGALAWHGYIHAGKRISILTAERAAPFEFGGKRLVPVRVPRDLARQEHFGGFIEWTEREGVSLPATTLERTVVDLLDRIDLAPPITHLQQLANHPSIDFDAMFSYAETLGHPVTAARLGWLVETNASIPSTMMWRLDRLTPKSSASWSRSLKGETVWLRRWKLRVPKTFD